MDYKNILKVVDELEEILINKNKIELNDYEIQKLNNIINELECTYQK